jgi:hypothetical protein
VTFIKIRSHRRKLSNSVNSDSVEQKNYLLRHYLQLQYQTEEVWTAFIRYIYFLGNNKRLDYQMLIEEILTKFQTVECNLSSKINFYFDICTCLSKNFVVVSEE